MINRRFYYFDLALQPFSLSLFVWPIFGTIAFSFIFIWYKKATHFASNVNPFATTDTLSDRTHAQMMMEKILF